MKKFNYHKYIIKLYNFFPKFIQNNIHFFMKRIKGDSWYGVFVLKNMYCDFKNMSQSQYENWIKAITLLSKRKEK